MRPSRRGSQSSHQRIIDSRGVCALPELRQNLLEGRTLAPHGSDSRRRDKRLTVTVMGKPTVELWIDREFFAKII
jgi:hypothetical protein